MKETGHRSAQWCIQRARLMVAGSLRHGRYERTGVSFRVEFEVLAEGTAVRMIRALLQNLHGGVGLTLSCQRRRRATALQLRER